MCGRLALNGFTHPGCRTERGIDRLTSFFHYDGPVKKAIKSIKYRGVSDLVKEFVNLAKTPNFSGFVLIPIPLYIKRLRQRGFNQAVALGSCLSIPMRTDILYRAKETKPQAEMKRKERLKNMNDVFRADASTHRRVILFDDVFTTGATMRAAASTLKRVGVKQVWAVTMAR